MSKPSRPPRFSLPWIEQIRTTLWALLLGTGMILSVVSVSQEPFAPNALGWDSSQGRVIESGFKVAGAGFVPEVRYRYVARGHRYSSSKIRENSIRFESQKEVEEWLADYPVGKSVTVYFRPMAEGYPVLDRGHAELCTAFVLSIAGAIVGFLGVRTNTRGGLPPR